MRFLIALFPALLLVSCTSAPTLPSPTPAPSITAEWPQASWTAKLVSSLEAKGAALPVPPKCARIPYLTALFVALAKYESGWKPAESYQEAFNGSDGKPVISRGLFQLSQGSVNGPRYRCGIEKAADLHDPATNIECAVTVANALARENGVLEGGSAGAWLGMARYWSPFRNAAKRAVILEKAAKAGGCQ